jgi:hypothetical protein
MKTVAPHMPRRIALEFVRGTMEFHQGSWSGQWLWEQPADDEIIGVGGIYGSPPDSFTVKEIIGEPKVTGDEAEIAKRADDQLYLVNLANRLWGDGEDEENTNFGYLDFSRTCDTSDIIACETFTVPFPALTLFEQIKYRFAMMFVNGPNYGHQWACNYLEELGNLYYERATEQIVWAGHDCDRDLSTFLDAVAKRGYTFPADRDRNYVAGEICSNSPDTEGWVTRWDERKRLFPTSIWGWKRDELIKLMAYAIDQAQEAWEGGDLKFGKDAPEGVLKWMKSVGIEPIEIKPTIYDAIRNGTLGDYMADS